MRCISSSSFSSLLPCLEEIQALWCLYTGHWWECKTKNWTSRLKRKPFKTTSRWGLMPTLLYARYPAPQIIQAVINIQNRPLYPSKISIFQQCCSGKNLIYNLSLLEVVCSDYFSLVPYWLLREGVQAFTAAVISRDVDPFWDYDLLWPQTQTFQQERNALWQQWW